MKNFLFFILLVGLTFQSCQKPTEEIIPESRVSIEGVSNRDASSEFTKHEGAVILGNTIPNPLSVENMKTAWNNLYDDKINLLLPTHKYVRFLPSPKEFETLQEMDDLILFDYPLNREIIRDGLVYHDPSIPENDITWQYAIVDIDFTSPVENYEVLEALVAPEYNSQWVKEAYRLKGLLYEGSPYGELNSAAPNITVNTEGMVVHPPGGLACSYPCVKAWKMGKEYCDCTGNDEIGDDPVSACGCDPSGNEHVPTGSVQVWDTQINGGQWEGVEGVNIYVWRKNIVWGHIWGRSTRTDVDGCWEIDREYKAKGLFSGKHKPITLGLRLKFKNDKVVIRGMASTDNPDIFTKEIPHDVLGYMEPVKDQMSRHAIDLRDFCIRYGPASSTEASGEAQKRYHAATAMNAFFEYNRYAQADGIVELDGIDILLHPYGDLGGASAPMLDKINGNLIAELAGTTYVTVLSMLVFGGPIGLTVGTVFAPMWVFAPDITYPYGSNNSDDIKETLYHEFAHASHFELQYHMYWISNAVRTIDNDLSNSNPPYGVATTSGAGRTAVIEMWGMHYGMTLADRQYGLEHSDGNASNPADMILERYNFQLERFVPNGSGMPGGWETDSWIPYGAFHDCVDNNTLNPPNVSEPATVVDGVMNFPHAAFFHSLTNAGNIPTVRDRLTTTLPMGQTSTAVNALFLSYGY